MPIRAMHAAGMLDGDPPRPSLYGCDLSQWMEWNAVHKHWLVALPKWKPHPATDVDLDEPPCLRWSVSGNPDGLWSLTQQGDTIFIAPSTAAAIILGEIFWPYLRDKHSLWDTMRARLEFRVHAHFYLGPEFIEKGEFAEFVAVHAACVWIKEQPDKPETGPTPPPSVLLSQLPQLDDHRS